jgi:glycosyltransferase involved in cell wall biosynthesis
MKLLIVSHACATPVNQQLFAEVQRQSTWNLTLVGPSRWIDDYQNERFLQRLPGFSARLIPIPVWMNGNVPLHVYSSTFRSVLHAVRPDVIYVHHEPYAAATAQVYLANRMWHGCPIGFFTWQNLLKRYPPPFRYTEQMVYRQSDFAFTGSESAASVLRQKGFEGPCSLLPGSIDPDVHRPVVDAVPPRASLGIEDDEVVLGFMGRLSAVKGLSTLIRALAQLPALPWHLVLVGDGDHTAALKKEAAALGLRDRVHFCGYVPHTEAPRYLSDFDVLVLPSETQANWKEQFGRVLVEALACGTPLVGSDSGEIPNVIRRTGGGVVFPEGDVGALGRTLAPMITDAHLRQRYARAGSASVLREYTDAVLASRFIDTIDAALARRSTSSFSFSLSVS